MSQWDEVLKDKDGEIVKPMDDYYLVFDTQPTFASDNWNRYNETNPEKPLGWLQFNSRWDSRETKWYTPIDYVNFFDHGLGITSKEYTTSYRYFTVVYYAVLNIGGNEMGPVNNPEFIFFIIIMMVSAFLKAIVFGDVASLISIMGLKQ